MISNLFYAFGKQEELQSRVKEQIPKRDCKGELVGFRCLEKLGSKIYFCFENQSAIVFQSLWLHARKLHYWLSFRPRCMECRRDLAMRILSVRLSVCQTPQTRDLWQNERKLCPHFYTTWKTIYPSFVIRKMVGGGDLFYLRFWVKLTTLERNGLFLIYFRP